MAFSTIVVILVFSLLFIGIAGYMIYLSIRLKKLREKLEDEEKE